MAVGHRGTPCIASGYKLLIGSGDPTSYNGF